MVLSNVEIIKEKNEGNIIIHPFISNNVQINSVDVTLGPYYYREKKTNNEILNIWSKESIDVWELNEAQPFDNDELVIWIEPGERILCHTNEFIGTKNNITTMMKTRSSLNRSFISTCLCAGLGDVGYFSRWTMEITNHSRYHKIPLIVGRRISQIVFFRTGEVDNSYKGKYQSSNNLNELINNWKPEDMLPKLYLDKK